MPGPLLHPGVEGKHLEDGTRLKIKARNRSWLQDPESGFSHSSIREVAKAGSWSGFELTYCM